MQTSKNQEKEQLVASTKIGPKHQITIPKEIYDRLHLAVGDFIEFRLTDDHVKVSPKKLVSHDDAWFYSKQWQQKERQADRDIAAGELSGPFTSAGSLRKHLGKLKKRKQN